MGSMVGGHARCFLSFIRNAAPPVPLHHLRWSPSPFRGGSAAIGREQTFPRSARVERSRDTHRIAPREASRLRSMRKDSGAATSATGRNRPKSLPPQKRTEERRVGKECVRTG